MLHINLRGEVIRSLHCESGPSHCQASLQWPGYMRAGNGLFLENEKQTKNCIEWPGK